MNDLSDMFAQAAAGYEKRDDMIERLLDRLVGLWHESDTDLPIHEWIGISREAYSAYVEQRR